MSKEEKSEIIDRPEGNETGDSIRVRGEMRKLLEDPYFQKIIDQDSLRNYQEMVGNADSGDTENLNSSYKLIKGQHEQILHFKDRITGHVEKAIQEKIITQEDRVFYKNKMKENVVNGRQNLTREMLE
ncbi:MAG: hypothetical protein HY982_01860, partial [Candidatus Magasanikbacteria bacterium]|nr:hypothetical protein [Candidatus Magasanikbacteria bacterium]